MTFRIALVAATLCACLFIPASSRAFDENVGKERIGARAGGVISNDGLHDAFGDGWEFTLYFNERLTRHLLIDVHLGALNMGDIQLEHLNNGLLLPSGGTEMRILCLTLGPAVGTSIGGGYSLDASVGAGIYSVSMVFNQGLDSSLTGYDTSQQKFGLTGGLGISRRLSTNWSIDANTSAHYVFIEENMNDIYWAFTDGADAPFLINITVGAVVDLR